MKWVFVGAVFILFLLLAANFAGGWSLSSASYNITGVLPDAGSRISSTNYILDATVGQPVIGEVSSTNYKLCLGYQCALAVIKISGPQNITFKGTLTEAGKLAAGISFTATVYNESFDPKSYSASNTTESDGNFTVTITGIPQEFVKAGFYIKMSSVGTKVEAEYICRYDPVERKCTKI